jgi:hypothetical protein
MTDSCRRDDAPARAKAEDGAVAEGLSAADVGKELGEHGKRARRGAVLGRHARLVSIVEAVLLSIVTLTAAWSGYAAAKWSSDSSLHLASASAKRAEANRFYQQALTLRAQDLSQFNAWFSAYLSHNESGQRVAEKRFRPDYDVAFRAWLATKPFTNPAAPKGPSNMPEYRLTGLARSRALDAQASSEYALGEEAAGHGDDYIRVTVVLASVLFLVGLSSHFPLTAIRWGLIGVGGALLVLAAVEIIRLPPPPGL